MWQAGDKLGRFRLEREIGQGSHGVVFVATDTALDSPVAVKILHPWLTQDTAVRDRFKRELLLARRVAHPGVCRLFDLHEEGEAFFITMDYVEGQTLLTILKNEGRIEPLRATRIMRGVCQALAAAHTAGVIHRDLKPANIIVRAGDSPMILDFGTATAGDVSRVTRPGTAVGSMRFIAPEVFTGVSPSIRTDIYSLGVVAYVTLAGKLPYNAAAGALEMLEMIRNQPPQRLDVAQPDVPPRLADVIARAMEKDPDGRFASSLAFDEALAEVERMMEASPPKVAGADFARWAPAAVISDAIHAATTNGAASSSPNGEGGGSFVGVPAPSDVKPAEPGLAVPPATVPQSAQAGVTVVNARAPGLSLGAPPTDPSSSAELPLVTGAALASAAPEDGNGFAPATDPSMPPMISVERGLTAVHGAEEAGPVDTTEEAADAPPLARGDITVRVARIGLDDEERAAVGSPGVLARLDKRVLLAAAGVGAIIIVSAVIALTGGDDTPAEPAVVAAAADAPGLAPVPATGPSGETGPADPDGAVDGAPVDVAALEFEEPEVEADVEIEPGQAAREPKPRRGKDKRLDRVYDDIRATRVAMQKRGLIPGDLPAVEELFLKARKQKDERLVAQARGIADRQVVDRAFVLAKLQRFNSKYDKSRRPDVADKVEPLAREAAASFAAGQFAQANEKLNRAFLLLRRKAK